MLCEVASSKGQFACFALVTFRSQITGRRHRPHCPARIAQYLLNHTDSCVNIRGGAGRQKHAKVFAMGGGDRYDSELESACKAVRLASTLCKKVQAQLQEGEAVDKADASPVTVADYGAQALVAWSLQQSLGSDGFSMVAEEATNDLRRSDGYREPGGAIMAERITTLVNGVIQEEEQAGALSQDEVLDLIDTGRSEGGPQGRHWVLDPIDGTRGFVGQRQYAVCLGLLDRGKAVVGVLGCPNLPQATITDADGSSQAASRSSDAAVGCLFAAQDGCGAFVGPLKGQGVPDERLQLEDVKDTAEARFMESFESAHSDQGFTSRLAQKLGITKPPLRIDSQTKYGALARGDAAINLRFPHAGYREKIWDHVAGYIIVKEAGGVITDASGAPLDFGKGRWLDLDRGIVTSTPTVHAALLRAIRELAEQPTQ